MDYFANYQNNRLNKSNCQCDIFYWANISKQQHNQIIDQFWKLNFSSTRLRHLVIKHLSCINYSITISLLYNRYCYSYLTCHQNFPQNQTRPSSIQSNIIPQSRFNKYDILQVLLNYVPMRVINSQPISMILGRNVKVVYQYFLELSYYLRHFARLFVHLCFPGCPKLIVRF